MRYAGLNKNDVVNGQGVCVTLFAQGCPHHCKGCFNPETWDFKGGREIDLNDLTYQIVQALKDNGIKRNFSVLGGEPLAPQNQENIARIIRAIRFHFPDIKIFLWTGYTLEELSEELSKGNQYIKSILYDINILIDGEFIQEKKDLTLTLRGSTNQRILYKDIDF